MTTPKPSTKAQRRRAPRVSGHVPVRRAAIPVATAVAAPVGAPETVASLLTASRAAHARYRQLDTATPGPGSPAMREALRGARHARMVAQGVDYKRADPAWAVDAGLTKCVSDDLVAFYDKALAPEVGYSFKRGEGITMTDHDAMQEFYARRY